MNRYYCHNCKDMYLKTPTAVVDHVWTGHGVFVEEIEQSIMRSEDARLPPEKAGKRRIGFRCDDCDLPFEGMFPFLRHLDKAHCIHIWYEKGLMKKRVYLDGILGAKTNNKTRQQEILATSKKGVHFPKDPMNQEKPMRTNNQHFKPTAPF